MRKVQDWENEKNANLAGRVKSKNADTEAIGRNTDAFQTKECLGYFWPQYLLKKLGKKQPRKQDMQVIWHKGQPIRGLVLDEEEGKPRGVIELPSRRKRSTKFRLWGRAARWCTPTARRRPCSISSGRPGNVWL
ncbi:hypothetical protein N9L68_02450 [bacterium]|nr:hypothetical protein [bacterium]